MVIKKSSAKTPNIKFMKIAAIIGFVILAYLTLSFVGVTIAGTAGSIISIIILLALLVFYFGFANLGKKSKSKSLVFSSWAIIASILAIIILYIIFYFIIKQYPVLASALLSPAGLEEKTIEIDHLMGVFGVLAIIFGLIFLFFGVVNYIFYIGLIKIKDKIKIAQTTGIVGLIGISILILFAFYFIYVASSGILSRELLLVLSGKASSVLDFIQAEVAIIQLLILASLLLESLTLLEGSKKFE